MKPLDRTDFEIIKQLQNNARLSNKELAQAVDLAPSSCHTRVRALDEAGVFRGFHADVDETAFGVGQQALYFVSLSVHTRDCCEQFRLDMIKLPQVITVYLISGKTDYVMHVMEKDTASLRNFALDNITSRSEVVRIETALIFDKQHSPVVPCYLDFE
jgi:DNA-binding Lrp family transcriptional regulator